MPTTLTDASSFDPVTGPIGTDIRNAASVRAALQTVANRTKFLYDRTTALADITALKAVSAPADGTVRHVKGYGLYTFDIGSAVAESLPEIVAPTVGTGRWFGVHVSAPGGSSNIPFGTPRTRKVIAPVQSFLVSGGGTPGAISPGAEGPGNFYFVDTGGRIIQAGFSLFFTVVNAGSSAHWGTLVDISPFMHDGATLTSAVLRLKGAPAHAGLPQTLPCFGVFRHAAASTSNDSLRAAGYSVSDAPANVAAYQAAHGITFTPNQFNVIDKASYTYWAHIFDEGGTNALVGTEYYGIELNFGSIADMRFP